ncbi:MAG TPA: pyridoxal-phosphate dependent enzyme [Anaerolineaceae bacterium]|nr:pyridoxal-phosphate dependent enzyme [Anaerolineaceae bacterium]
MPTIRCGKCNQPYPDRGVPYRCPNCGGIYDFDGPPEFNKNAIEKDLPGLWRYRHSFGLFEDAPLVTLGEGNTPLVWTDANGLKVGLKLESLNPSGSFKDRGSAVQISQLLARGIHLAVEDSSGNAGASFAAYAARAGLKTRVFVPESASGPKRRQIELYGAQLVSVPGPRSAAAQAVLKEVDAGAVYGSHAYLPFGLMGYATIAYEIWENLGAAPGTVVAPVGHGSLLLGIMRGFAALRQSGLILNLPYYVGVQAEACAPVVTAFTRGKEAAKNIVEGQTVAEGVKVSQPVRLGALLAEIPKGSGEFISIQEEAILPAYRELAKKGMYVEPTSALVWCTLDKIAGRVPEPVVLILSGSGLKYQS